MVQDFVHQLEDQVFKKFLGGALWRSSWSARAPHKNFLIFLGLCLGPLTLLLTLTLSLSLFGREFNKKLFKGCPWGLLGNPGGSWGVMGGPEGPGGPLGAPGGESGEEGE